MCMCAKITNPWFTVSRRFQANTDFAIFNPKSIYWQELYSKWFIQFNTLLNSFRSNKTGYSGCHHMATHLFWYSQSLCRAKRNRHLKKIWSKLLVVLHRSFGKDCSLQPQTCTDFKWTHNQRSPTCDYVQSQDLYIQVLQRWLWLLSGPTRWPGSLLGYPLLPLLLLCGCQEEEDSVSAKRKRVGECM